VIVGNVQVCAEEDAVPTFIVMLRFEFSRYRQDLPGAKKDCASLEVSEICDKASELSMTVERKIAAVFIWPPYGECVKRNVDD